MPHPETNQTIRTADCPNCPICDRLGEPLYQALTDHLFEAPGKWNLKKCPDSTCGLIWLDPMPIEEDIIKAYETYYTHDSVSRPPVDSWSRRAIEFIKKGYLAREYKYEIQGVGRLQRSLSILAYLHPARKAWLDFNSMYLPAYPGGRLLEVGCGSGKMLKGMAELGWQVEGVDFDPGAVENAKRQGVLVQTGTLEEQNYPDNCFEAISMSHLIEHVANPLGLLQECHRILRSEGYLVIVTPNSEALGHKWFREAWRGLEPPRHLHIYNRYSLGQVVQRAKFEDFAISTTIRNADKIFELSSKINHMADVSTNSRTLHLKAKAFQLLEWLILKIQPFKGEELVLIGRK